MRQRMVFTAAMLAIAGLGLGGCAGGDVTFDPDGNAITVEHLSTKLIWAEFQADQFCGEQGKQAVLVQTRRVDGAYFPLQTSQSTYECVEKTKSKP